jgi:hypothetical protein
MRAYRTICAVLLTVLGASAAFAEPVALQYKFKVADIDKYKMTMDMSMQIPGTPAKEGASPMSMSMTMTCTQHTLAVNPDGSAKIKATYGKPTITGQPASAKGAKMPNLAGQSITYTMSKRGQTLSVEGLEKLMQGTPLKNMDFSGLFSSASNQALLPEGPVEVGDSWYQSVPFPFGGGTVGVNSELESADQQIWGLRAAKIRQTFAGTLDLGELMKSIVAGLDTTGTHSSDLSSMSGSMDLNGDMSFLFAPSIGKLLKGNGIMQANMTMNMPSSAVSQGAPSTLEMNMTMRITITRFK